MAMLNDEKKRPDPIIIDPFGGDVDALAEQQLDKEADAYESVKPPRAGRYDLRIVLAKNGTTLNETDDGEKYYSQKLECYIVNAKNPEDNGVPVDSIVSTYLGRGKKINTMLWLLLKAGKKPEKIPAAISQGDLLQMFCKYFGQGDKVIPKCLCDWQGWSKELGRNVYLTEKDFPVDKEGEPIHQVVHKHGGKNGTSEEITGRLKRKDWGPTPGKEGATGGRPAAPTATAAKPAPKPAPKPAVVEDDDEDEEALPAKQAKPAAAPPASGKAKKPAVTVDTALAGLDDDDDE